MFVVKRDNSRELHDSSNIRKQTIACVEDLNLSYEKLELEAQISFVDGMKTSNIQKILTLTALNLNSIDEPNWIYAAGRLELYNLYHNTKKVYDVSKKRGQVYDAINLFDYAKKHSELTYDPYMFDLAELNDYIDPERDKLFTYLGVETLIKRYLLKDKQTGFVTELPQHFLMSLAMFLASKEEATKRTEWAKIFYNQMSLLKFLPATPTLSNGRVLNGNCMSCAVGSTPDNLEGIFNTYSEQAQGSKHGTGFGWDWTRVRALGGIINNTKDASGGLIPWLKIENDIAVAVDQLGVRLGAIAVSIEVWHKDVIDYLDLKKNSGEEKRRAKELFIALSITDIFMRRVETEKDFTLFDPYDVPELSETFGAAHEIAYLNAENRFKLEPESFTNEPLVINAKSLYKRMQTVYWETGMPFLIFKDNANIAHQNKREGVIRSSNLCTEIFQPASENKTILCNLGSINLSKCNSVEDLKETIPIAMRMLDNVVDLNYYAIPKSEKNQKRTRAIGLGIAGEAEMIANKQMMYGSKEHKNLIRELYSNFAEISDKASKELGAEKGTWNEDSPYRNAYRRAIAPTSSVSILFGTTAMHEPVYNKIWIEDNKLGAFKMTAPNITADNYNFYVNAYDVNQQDMVECTSIRQEFIDQGISHNLYFRPGASGKEVYDTIMYAWKKELKSLYYLRSESLDIQEPREYVIKCYGCEG